ncbi:hypothetical protein SDC9_195656 [bioreactor metagenome]|uniref:Uncharacterized protein n=1 Tax=bioreactor metagenome TaxID=1076179 RepID=A0A645IB53_9ZZZZ
MIVGIFIVGVEQIVVYVADGFLRPHPLYPEGLEGKIGLRPRDVVRQRLVDPDRYLLPRPHNSAQQMASDYFPGNILAHALCPLYMFLCDFLMHITLNEEHPAVKLPYSIVLHTKAV